jgi:outer membrane protein OmpA-like peptidoglycan-associated protein
LVIFIILLNIILFLSSQAQDHQSHFVNKRYYKSHYKKVNMRYANACNVLERKRYDIPRKPLISAHHKTKPRSMAEIDPSTVVAKAPVSKPAPKAVVTRSVPASLPITPKVEQISEKKLVELHHKEDEVLAINHLPVPTSQKHDQVRNRVHEKLVSKTNIYPLALDPLFFNFGEDEFSMVDMEPFLMAAEYAMQGRTVLIEGHTDSRGADDFNVKLSMKRVQKIRQLMLDMGVPDDRISVVGYGEEIKATSNTTASGRQNNRRVDFTIF